MSDDLLKQYTSALKQEYDGATAFPEASRAKVIRSLAERRPRRARWWVIGIPLLVIFGGSTAWAAATGQLDSIVERATIALGISDPPPKPKLALHKQRRGAARPKTAAQDVEAQPSSVELPEATSALPALQPDPPAMPKTDSATMDQTALEMAAERRRKEEAEALASYQTAHKAHFSAGDCVAALPAYTAYLSRYPQGSLVLEAKYNRALCLVKTGQMDEARAALLPFASGTFGNYRQSQAHALLEALAKASSPSEPSAETAE